MGTIRGASVVVRTGLVGSASLALAAVLAGASWQVVSGPGGQGNALTGVSCTSPVFCVAVGQAGSGATLAEMWNGQSWSITPGAPPQSPTSSLASVACLSAHSCWAIGVAQRPLFEHWDGAQWSVMSGPVGRWSPTGLSCPNTRVCVAAGSSITATELAVWSDGRWVVGHGAKSEASARLPSVSCASSAFCEAVGVLHRGTRAEIPAAETWDGQHWANSHPIAPRYASLGGVSCWSIAGCLAVGSTSARSVRFSGFAEHWDGLRWSRVKVPTARGEDLLGVACTRHGRCLIVGHDAAQPVVFSWSGAAMQRAQTPRVPIGDVLTAISLSGGLGVAVGYTSGIGGAPGSSLIEMQE